MSYDILIFQGVKPSGEAAVSLKLGNPGAFISGIQKVAQTFIKLFLTDRGTVDGDPAMGTDFLSQMRSGFIRDEVSMQSMFQSSVLDVKNYISEYEKTDAPDDERLDSAELISWDLRPGFFSITVRIVTAAGDSRAFTMPVEARAIT